MFVKIREELRKVLYENYIDHKVTPELLQNIKIKSRQVLDSLCRDGATDTTCINIDCKNDEMNDVSILISCNKGLTAENACPHCPIFEAYDIVRMPLYDGVNSKPWENQ